MPDNSVDTTAHLQQLETELLQPSFRRSREAVSALLASDFREFGSSGRIFTKEQILAELQTEPARRISLLEFHCEFPAPDVALATYRSLTLIEGQAPTQALRSSIWVYRDKRWQMIFHQGTRTTSE